MTSSQTESPSASEPIGDQHHRGGSSRTTKDIITGQGHSPGRPPGVPPREVSSSAPEVNGI
jgi:hypothetical protein